MPNDTQDAPLHIRFSETASMTNVIGGALMALVTLGGGILTYRRIVADFSGTFDAVPYALYGELALLCVLFPIGFLGSLICFFNGLGRLISGLRRLLKPVLYVAGPESFADYCNELFKGIQEGTLIFYGSISPLLRSLFGKNVTSLPPSARDIVARNGRALLRRAATVPLLCVATYFVASGALWPGDPNSRYLFIPLGLLIIGSTAQGIVEFVTSGWLVPDSPRLARSDYEAVHYKGFGHPTHLFSRIPIKARELELPGWQNITELWYDTEKGGAVRDVGEFKGEMFIERQPEVVSAENPRSGLLLLRSGWFLHIVAGTLFAFSLVPPQLDISISTSTAAYAFIVVCSAFTFYFQGRRFKRQSARLLEVFRFRSIGILISLSGEMSRADVRVGAGADDTMDSHNVTTRSNFTAQFWAAELISEAETLDHPRHLLAVQTTPESSKWLTTIRDGLHELREDRVRPLGIDFSAEEVSEIAQVNQALIQQRAKAAQQGVISAPLNGVPEIDGPSLLAAEATAPSQAPAPQSPDQADFQECPECAEMIRLRARKCRFCGYRFQDLDASE